MMFPTETWNILEHWRHKSWQEKSPFKRSLTDKKPVPKGLSKASVKKNKGNIIYKPQGMDSYFSPPCLCMDWLLIILQLIPVFALFIWTSGKLNSTSHSWNFIEESHFWGICTSDQVQVCVPGLIFFHKIMRNQK